MVDTGIILQNAILYITGNEGLVKFGRAGHKTSTGKLVRPDGSLNLPQLMNMLLDVFPEEQASAIADEALLKYMAEVNQQAKAKEYEKRAVPAPVKAPAPEDGYENNLAKYLETDASDVRDLIEEARKIRIAMGKSLPPKIDISREPVLDDLEHYEPVKPVISLVSPKASVIMAPPVVMAPMAPAQAELAADVLESEISRFMGAGKAYSSVDIIDFIRYLKDKGYHFQENTVLEKVYTWLDDRKNKERERLMVDIHDLLARTPWPTESEVSAYVEEKKSEGIMCEGSEIKRMILLEMIRKH
jgi:hypothetical protein